LIDGTSFEPFYIPGCPVQGSPSEEPPLFHFRHEAEDPIQQEGVTLF